MAVSVESLSADTVVLSAPLAPNINHRETVFGGSASAVAILAAWCLLHTGLHRDGLTSRLVIQRNTMEYRLPILGGFCARSVLRDDAEWSRFTATLVRRGKARIKLPAVLEYAGQVAGELIGEFVALGDGGG